jgi:endonuclease-8
MEGPSLVIAREDMSSAIGKKVLRVAGNSRIPIRSLKGQKLSEIGTWGKHLLLFFSDATVKIHFLLWGSYRINKPRPKRKARMILGFENLTIYFYSCSIQFLTEDVEKLYDWSADVMSPSWDNAKALRKILKRPHEMVCDVLMEQSIFSGVGNIIKNESLFNLRLHPERLISTLSRLEARSLVREAHDYTWKFYAWKQAFVLKKHWRIMRKKICPRCEGKVLHRITGRKRRLSHFCPHCQPKVTKKEACLRRGNSWSNQQLTL